VNLPAVVIPLNARPVAPSYWTRPPVTVPEKPEDKLPDPAFRAFLKSTIVSVFMLGLLCYAAPPLLLPCLGVGVVFVIAATLLSSNTPVPTPEPPPEPYKEPEGLLSQADAAERLFELLIDHWERERRA
jgi:hypothetical protein